MKKGFLKRIIAIALAFFMAMSGLQYGGSVSEAAESYSGILTMNRAEGSANATAIYFMGTDTMPITGTDGSGDAWTYNVLQAADAESGIFLNGEPMTARLLKYCTVPCRYYMSFDEVQNGDAITIKGTFTISNGNAITFREMTYTYNAETGKWSESMPADESAVMSLESGNGDAGFYAVASDSMPIVSWTESIFPILDGKSGVWVNDVWKNVPIKRHSEDKYYVGLLDGVDGGACTAQAGDVIRFGGKYTYGGYIVEFAEIAFEFDGTNWIELKPVADIALTLHDAEVKNGGSKNVAFYAASFDELEPLGWEGAAYKAMNEESGIFVNGTRHQGSIKNYANGRYYVEGFSAVEAGQTVTVKGKFRSNGGTKDINVPEVSFLFNGSYWEEIITSADATGTFTQIDYDYNTAKNVSLFADYTHPVTSWDKNFLAASGENGLFLNGNKVDIPMKQYAAGKYFIALSDVGVVPVKGDVLEVKGCFTMGGSSVQFAPVVLTFNGAAWSTDMPAVPYTDVAVTGAEGVNAGADGHGAYWDLNLRTDAEIPGENWGTQYFDAVIEYKGNPIARTFVKRAGETVLNVFFYDSIVPDKQVGDTLVLKSGEYQAYSVSTYRPSGYGMKLTKDFAFTWDGTTWVQAAEEEVKAVLPSLKSGDANGIALSVNATLPSGDVAFANGGVYVNGELRTDVAAVSDGNGTVSIAYAASDEDVIAIAGETADCVLGPVAFRYHAEAWENTLVAAGTETFEYASLISNSTFDANVDGWQINGTSATENDNLEWTADGYNGGGLKVIHTAAGITNQFKYRNSDYIDIERGATYMVRFKVNATGNMKLGVSLRQNGQTRTDGLGAHADQVHPWIVINGGTNGWQEMNFKFVIPNDDETMTAVKVQLDNIFESSDATIIYDDVAFYKIADAPVVEEEEKHFIELTFSDYGIADGTVYGEDSSQCADLAISPITTVDGVAFSGKISFQDRGSYLSIGGDKNHPQSQMFNFGIRHQGIDYVIIRDFQDTSHGESGKHNLYEGKLNQLYDFRVTFEPVDEGVLVTSYIDGVEVLQYTSKTDVRHPRLYVKNATVYSVKVETDYNELTFADIGFFNGIQSQAHKLIPGVDSMDGVAFSGKVTFQTQSEYVGIGVGTTDYIAKVGIRNNKFIVRDLNDTSHGDGGKYNLFDGEVGKEYEFRATFDEVENGMLVTWYIDGKFAVQYTSKADTLRPEVCVPPSTITSSFGKDVEVNNEAFAQIGKTAAQDSQSRYLLYLNLKDGYQLSTKETKVATFIVNGEEMLLEMHMVDDSVANNQLLLLIPYSKLGITAATELSEANISLAAGSVIRSKTGGADRSLKTKNNLFIKLKGSTIINESYDEVELTYDYSGAQDASTRYLFGIKVKGSYMTDRFWSGNTILIDGKEVSGDGINWTPASGEGSDSLLFLVQYSRIEEGVTTVADFASAHTITIPAGTLIGTSHKLKVKKDLVFTVNKGTITQQYVADASATVGNSGGNSVGSATTGIYFTLPENNLPFNGDWSVKADVVGGEVKINGQVQTTYDVTKLSETLYFLSFGAEKYQAGDCVEFSLMLKDKEKDYVVEVETATFKYLGEGNWDVHTHNKVEIPAVAPTCTTDGMTAGEKCDGCNFVYVAPVVDPMKGHSMQYTPAKDATTSEKGNYEYWYCSVCDKYFADEAGTNEKTLDELTIPALGHTLVHFDAVAPGCHSKGNVEYWYCSDCEGFWTDEACTQVTNSKNVILPATGSDNLTHVEAVAPTCTSLGNVEYWYCPDCEGFWLDAACTRVTNSKSVKLAAAEHTLVHFDAVEPGCHFKGNVEYWFCSVCEGFWTDEACTQVTNSKNVVLPATGSDNFTHVEAVAPTCTSLGNVEYWHCSDCEGFWLDELCTRVTNSKSVILPAAEHTLVHFDAVEPGCHFRGNVEYWFCSVCEGFWTDEACTELTNSKSVILPATGSDNFKHVEAVAPTCTTEGNVEYWYCSDCEGFWLDEACTLVTNSKSVKLGNADHKLVTVKGTPATTSKTGLTDGEKCSVCGTWTKEQKTIAKLTKPAKSSISKLTGAKKKITVKFKKVKDIKGYEIQFSTKKNMKKNVKLVNVSAKATKKVVKGLKAKTKYWVRIRTYKVVDGEKVYSDWSKKKTVKTK